MRRMRRGGPRAGVVLLVLALAALVLGGRAGTAVAQDDEETYESPLYGYTLFYDAEEWEVFEEDEDPDDPYDTLFLGNGVSNVALIGDPDYDEDELDDCVDDYLGGIEENASFTDIEPYDEPGAEGEDDDRAWASFTYTFEFEDGEELDFVRYIECRALGDGVTLTIIHDAEVEDYEDEVAAREDLLEGLEAPGASDDENQGRAGTRIDDANASADDNDDDGTPTSGDDAEDDPDPDDAGSTAGDDAEIGDGSWVGETGDGEGFSLTVRDGGISAVSYAYACNGEPVFASASNSDPAPIEDGEFTFEVDTSDRTTVVTGTFANGEAEGTLRSETTDTSECDVELDWTAEEP